MEVFYNITLKFPRRMIVYGPSGSGKTTFVENLMINMKQLFDFYFDNIIYCSGQSFPKFDSIHGIEIRKIHNIDREIIEKY